MKREVEQRDLLEFKQVLIMLAIFFGGGFLGYISASKEHDREVNHLIFRLASKDDKLVTCQRRLLFRDLAAATDQD